MDESRILNRRELSQLVVCDGLVDNLDAEQEIDIRILGAVWIYKCALAVLRPAQGFYES